MSLFGSCSSTNTDPSSAPVSATGFVATLAQSPAVGNHHTHVTNVPRSHQSRSATDCGLSANLAIACSGHIDPSSSKLHAATAPGHDAGARAADDAQPGHGATGHAQTSCTSDWSPTDISAHLPWRCAATGNRTGNASSRTQPTSSIAKITASHLAQPAANLVESRKFHHRISAATLSCCAGFDDVLYQKHESPYLARVRFFYIEILKA